MKKKNKGFTLVELLLVVTIISILAAVIAPRYFGRSKDAQVAAAKQVIVGTLGIALNLYEQDNGKYPEVLTELLGANGGRSYLQATIIPEDPWGNEYSYVYPSAITGLDTTYDLVSAGPDGVVGSDDDITNHNVYINEQKVSQ